MSLDGVVNAWADGGFLRPKMKFCGKNHFFSERSQSFADEFLVVPWVKDDVALYFGRIKEIAAGLKSLAHGIDAVLSWRHLAVAVRKAHASYADGRDVEVS